MTAHARGAVAANADTDSTILDDAVEHFAFLDQTELVTGPLFDAVQTRFQIFHIHFQQGIAIAQPIILRLLTGDLVLQGVSFGQAAGAMPQPRLQRTAHQQKDDCQSLHHGHPGQFAAAAAAEVSQKASGFAYRLLRFASSWETIRLCR